MKLLLKIYRFISSVKLAIVVILSLAIVLSVATIIESIHDTPSARHYVYQTGWFYGVLFLMGVNVFAATLTRIPWKKHHIGFLVTHLGIITLLIGSFVSLQAGFEGSMALAEGESSDRMNIDEPYLYLFNHAQGKITSIPMQLRFNPPTVEQPLVYKAIKDKNIDVTIDRYYYKSSKQRSVSDQNDHEEPAVQIELANSKMQFQEWVFAKDIFVDLGPATVVFNSIKSKSEIATIQDIPQIQEKPNVLLIFGLAKKVFIKVKKSGVWQAEQHVELNQTVPLGWMDIQFKLLKYYPKALEQISYREIFNKKITDAATSVLHLILDDGVKKTDHWMQLGDFFSRELAGEQYSIFYRFQSRELGFYLGLEKFNIVMQEGSQNPASFESDVYVKQAKEGEQIHQQKIYMNNPLVKDQYKVFQASYQINNDGTKLSIFQISYDPGIKIKYLGSGLIVLGIILMFYFKPLFISRWVQRNKEGID